MASPLAVTRAAPIAREPHRGAAARTRPTLVQAPAQSDRAAAAGPAVDRTILGLSALLLSTLLFPLADMVSKALAADYSGVQITWMRYVVLVLVIAPFALRRPTVFRTARPLVQMGRGLSSVAATCLALIGFTFLPVAEATAIGFCAPLIVTALAAIILKEAVGWQRWVAALVGFAGILIIVQPSPGAFRLPTLLPLCSSLFSALTVITTRLGRDERVETTVLYSACVGLVVITLAVVPVWRPLDTRAIELGALMGALAAAASILQVVAYRCAPSSLLAPFSYSQILWAIGLGWLVFGSVPGMAMLAGSSVVIASGCSAAFQSRKRRRNWPALRRELENLTASRDARAA